MRFLTPRGRSDFMEVHKQQWKGWEGETEVRELMEMPTSGASSTRG